MKQIKILFSFIPNRIQKLAFPAARKAQRSKDRKRPSIKSIWGRLKYLLRGALAHLKCQLLNYVRYIFLILFLSSPMLEATESEDPIVVRLATETKLIPLYLTLFEGSNSNLDANYCQQLEKVLQFDLDHNGMTYLIKVTDEKEKRAAASQFNQSPKASDWKALKAFYVVKVQIQDKKLAARLFSANTEVTKSIDNIILTGNLANDRRQIHQLADIIFKTLFGKDGIATTRIIYTVKSKQGSTWNSEMWESDYDGGNARQLTQDSGYAITPVYVPPKAGFTSGTFFFVSYKTGQPKIYYQSLAPNAEAHRLTFLRGNQLMPTITKQRDKLAFICDITGNPDLFVQAFSPEAGAIGKPYQIFSTHQATQGTPTFSPDGSQIAFVSNKDGSPRIYVINVPEAGTSLKDIKATLITKRNRESSAPAWSPDGTKIAYCSMVEGARQVWVYDFATREERQLTQGRGNKENPSWAPDSLHLVFNSSDAGACDLYLINLNQADAAKITSGAGEKRFPCWEPR